MISPTPDPFCAVVLGMSALLAMWTGREAPWEFDESGAAVPAWVAPTTLAAMAAASSIFGILDPDTCLFAFAGP